jgi:hypothetical protein
MTCMAQLGYGDSWTGRIGSRTMFINAMNARAAMKAAFAASTRLVFPMDQAIRAYDPIPEPHPMFLDALFAAEPSLAGSWTIQMTRVDHTGESLGYLVEQMATAMSFISSEPHPLADACDEPGYWLAAAEHMLLAQDLPDGPHAEQAHALRI